MPYCLFDLLTIRCGMRRHVNELVDHQEYYADGSRLIHFYAKQQEEKSVSETSSTLARIEKILLEADPSNSLRDLKRQVAQLAKQVEMQRS
mmetsp:Transcript_49258/g.128520  ORF Transcript_49258/g.128520 Transcript_49258/m.128520 type:complete len:91 (+) Transcript_49258:1043-1315(+)